MLSDTLTQGLAAYRIGPKIRELRLRKDMGLVQLGQHTGLSSGMLSRIERGQLFPTLPTLLRIALVFGVGLEHFFAEDKDRPVRVVVRKGDRLRLPNDMEASQPSYFFESLDFPVTDAKLNGFYAEFPAHADKSPPHKHPGVELIYVTRGRVVVAIGKDETVLAEGDVMYFDSSVPHSYGQKGHLAAAAIVVVTE